MDFSETIQIWRRRRALTATLLIVLSAGAAAAHAAGAQAVGAQAVGAHTAGAQGVGVRPAIAARTAGVPQAIVARTAVAPPATAAAAKTIVVTNRRSSGVGSLRAAIERADAGPPGRAAVIDFAVRGSITLASQLPAITREVTIDGRSAPGYVAGGPPVVEIDCQRHAGLLFAAGSARSQLLGVAVDDARGSGVTLSASSVTVNGDYIGLDLAGTAFGNHGDGVYVTARSWRNRIGLNKSRAAGVVGNVISGNAGSGIALIGSSDDVVVANRIGTNAAGTKAIPNKGNGISITHRSDYNEIGGTDFIDLATGQANNPTGSKGTVTPVFVVPPLGNLISGNGKNGILIGTGSRKNTLNGNFIGTTADGDAPLGNAGDGVRIDRANDNALVGCKFVNNPFVYYNVVSGNGMNGLRITSSDNVLVQGNFFGVRADNTGAVRNRLDGILVDGTSADTQVGGVIPLGNVSAGNGRNGIEVAGRARGFVTFNTFGGLLAFKGAAPNGDDGLLITSTGGDNLARTNVFSGNRRNGIELAGHASGVTVDPDIAGLTTNGKSPLPNGRDGLLIDGNAHDNVIGGSLRSVIPQDTFSGNAGYGVAIAGDAHGNRVFSSFIGTEIGGLARLGNGRGGVLICGSAYRNIIGRANLKPANLISGNKGNGVTLCHGTSRNLVINNYIGLDRAGHYLRNTGRPVVNRGRGNILLGNRYRP